MQLTNENISLTVFNALCDELGTSKLFSREECQYWLFECSYKAAVEELIHNISVAANAQDSVLLEEKYLAKEAAHH